MKKVKFGIIGIGNQGSYYANLLKEGRISNGVLSALCDNNPAKLELAKERFSMNENIVFMDDYIKLLDAGVCDAVLVETPHYQHPAAV